MADRKIVPLISLFSISTDVGTSRVAGAVTRHNDDEDRRNIFIPNANHHHLASAAQCQQQQLLQQKEQKMETTKMDLDGKIEEEEIVNGEKSTERTCQGFDRTNSTKLRLMSTHCPYSHQLFSAQQQLIPYHHQQLLHHHQLILQMHATRSYQQQANHSAVEPGNRNRLIRPTNPLLNFLHPLLLQDRLRMASSRIPSSVALGCFLDAASSSSSLHPVFGTQPSSALSQSSSPPFDDIPPAPAPLPQQHQYLLQPLSFHRVHGAWVGAAITTPTLTKSGQTTSADPALGFHEVAAQLNT